MVADCAADICDATGRVLSRHVGEDTSIIGSVFYVTLQATAEREALVLAVRGAAEVGWVNEGRFAVAAERPDFECTRIASSIWLPTRCTGLSECRAPWNTMDAPAQRSARRSPHRMVSTSEPLTRTA